LEGGDDADNRDWKMQSASRPATRKGSPWTGCRTGERRSRAVLGRAPRYSRAWARGGDAFTPPSPNVGHHV